MASLTPLSVSLFLVFILLARPTFSDHSPESPPSPSPQPPSPSPAAFNSPPAPPPSDLAPKSPSQAPSPSPSPAVAGHVTHDDQSAAEDLERKEDSSGGMSGGKKAGVAFGVIAAACVVGIGAVVYKKRKQNIQRSEYGYTARRDIL